MNKAECYICGEKEGKLKKTLNRFYCYTCYKEFGKEEEREIIMEVKNE